jgi:hypothetical protein
MKFFKFFIFTLFSIVDVRIHAATLALPFQKDIVQEPSSCLETEKVCAIKTLKGRKFEFKIGTVQIIMGSGSSLIRTGVNSAILLTGEMWVRADSSFEVQSEFGIYKIFHGEAWIIRSEDRLTVRTIRGIGELTPRGDQSLPLPAGFEMWIAGIGKKGHATASVPQVFDFKDQVRRWAKLYPLSRKNFKDELKFLRETLVVAVEMSSEFNSKIVQREVASTYTYEAKIRKERLERERLKEAIALKALFRKKQFE